VCLFLYICIPITYSYLYIRSNSKSYQPKMVIRRFSKRSVDQNIDGTSKFVEGIICDINENLI